MLIKEDNNTEETTDWGFYDFDVEVESFGSGSAEIKLTLYLDGEMEETQEYILDIDYSSSPYESPTMEYPGWGGGLDEWSVEKMRMIYPEEKQMDKFAMDYFLGNKRISKSIDDAMSDAFSDYESDNDGYYED